MSRIDPAHEVVLVLPGDEHHLGDDDAGLGDEAAAGLGHHLTSVPKR